MKDADLLSQCCATLATHEHCPSPQSLCMTIVPVDQIRATSDVVLRLAEAKALLTSITQGEYVGSEIRLAKAWLAKEEGR